MKKGTPVEVTWIDAHGGSYREWSELKPHHHQPERVRTVGQVNKHDKEGISVILSYVDHEDDGYFDAYVFIPSCMIQKVRRLK